MRHQVAFRKLSRTASHREAMFKNMLASLVLHGRIETTVQKAKEIRPIAEKFVTIAKSDNLTNRRKAYSFFNDKKAVQRLFTDIAPLFKTRNGGYTRIVRSGTRPGDAADKAIIEFVDKPLPKVAASTTNTEKDSAKSNAKKSVKKDVKN